MKDVYMPPKYDNLVPTEQGERLEIFEYAISYQDNIGHAKTLFLFGL